MIECLRSAKLVEPGARTPPTEPLKSVSPVKTSPPTTKVSIPAVWPGRVQRLDAQAARLDRSPGSIVRSTSSSRAASSGWARISTPKRSLNTWFSATWSAWWWVSSRCVTSSPCRSIASSSGSDGPPESISTPLPPGSSPTR